MTNMIRLIAAVWMCVVAGCGASRTVAQGSATGGDHQEPGSALAMDSSDAQAQWLGGSAISGTVLHGGAGDTHIGGLALTDLLCRGI